MAQLAVNGVPILAILVVLPTERVSSLHGLIDALETVITVYGGSVATDGTVTLTGAGAVLGAISAAVFIWVLLASGSSWIMGAGRAQAAACLDGAGPAALRRTSARTGVPVRMALVSGGVSMLAVIGHLSLTGGDAQKHFSAALTTAIALIVPAYLLIFPAFVAPRIRRPRLDRPFLAPGGLPVAWLVSICTTVWSGLAATCLVWPGFGTSHPDAALPAGFAGRRAEFELLVLTPIGLVAVVACCFYVLGARHIEHRR